MITGGPRTGRGVGGVTGLARRTRRVGFGACEAGGGCTGYRGGRAVRGARGVRGAKGAEAYELREVHEVQREANWLSCGLLVGRAMGCRPGGWGGRSDGGSGRGRCGERPWTAGWGRDEGWG